MRSRVTVGVVAVFVAMALLPLHRAYGEEKYWIAHEATLIVVGTMHANMTFPWFDGWHLTGTIEVDEILYGTRPAGPIRYRYVCAYEWCRNWPPPKFAGNFTGKAMWFLRPLNGNLWQGSTGLGFCDISARADYENYIRRYKRPSSR